MKTNARLATSALIISVLSFALCPTAQAESNWPRFGGAEGDFQTAEKGIPTSWTESDVVWKTQLGGVGQSSPILWGEKVFVTTSEQNDAGQVTRNVLCLNRQDGKILWKKQAAVGPGEELHKMNTWATPSCATDGERVVAYFGPGGLHSYTTGGEHEWSLELVKPAGPWGFAGSPIILGDMVIQNCDAEGESFLIAVNKTDGKEVWRTKRKELPRGGWSTPILIDTGKRKELVLNGEFGVQGYDPATGEDLWYCKSFNGRGTPVPAFTHGVLVTVNGKPGDIYAVRPGGSGDVTKSHMAWHTARGGGRDLPSPVAVGDYIFTVNMTGIATLYDADGGKEVWKSRLGGNFSATPFIAEGLIFALDEDGITHVIRPGEKLDVVAKNGAGAADGEIFRASPTPSTARCFCAATKCCTASAARPRNSQ